MKMPSIHNAQRSVQQFISDVRQREVIASYCVIRFLGAATQFIIAATFIPFLLGHGLTLSQASLVAVTFTAGNMLAQLPTGAIADAAGRKLSIILSGAFLALGFGAFAVSSTFMAFAEAELLVAVGVAFYSGAINAWVYDHLQFVGRKEESEKVFAKGFKFSLTGTALAGLAGGYLAALNTTWPWVGGALLALAQLAAAAWLMREYPHQADEDQLLGWWEFPKIIRGSLRYSRHHAVIPLLLVAALIAQAGLQPLQEFWAPWLNQLAGGNHPTWLGWMWVGMSAFLYIGSEVANRMSESKEYSPRRKLLTASALLAIPAFLAGIGPGLFVTLGWLWVNQIGQGMYSPISQAYFNSQIEAGQGRATILSLETMVGQIGSVVSLLAFGWLGQSTSIGFTWLIAGAILLWLMPIYYIAVNKESVMQAR